MIKATRINNTIVCVIEGKMFQKSFETDKEIMSIYEKALNTDETNQLEVIDLKEKFATELTHEEKERKNAQKAELEEVEKSKDLLEWMNEIKDLGDTHFRVEGLKLYMKGIDITIPEFLAREFAERRANDEDLSSLQNFWRLCALNPDPRCREDLYKFLINNNMVVTPSGYFLAYRNADIKQEGNRELNEFVGLHYTKIKNWKKNVKNYIVYKDGSEEYCCATSDKFDRVKRTEGEFIDFEYIGILSDLYNEISNEGTGTVYTDERTGETIIKLGSPVSIDRKDCDANPDQTCSRGLHLGSTDFMSQGNFGQVGLVCLCNPMNVVAVPYAGGQKLRTSEYLPIGISEYDENRRIIPIETATFEYEYAEHTEEELFKMLETASFESLKEHEIVPKELRLQNFKAIVEDFMVVTKEINEQIKSRIIKVD